MLQAQVKPLTGRSFHLGLMATITFLVLYGFSHTVGADIFHPSEAPPLILYIHAAVFTGWLFLLLVQTALIASRNVRLHRKLGLAGLAFGLLMIGLGIATTIIMGRIHVLHEGPVDGAMFVYRPFEDILFFAIAFGLAIHWRKRPDLHRRLIVLAAVAVTPPGISRIPMIHSLGMVYLIADALIMVAMMHDLVTTRRIHKVYRWGLAAAMAGQTALLLILSHKPAMFVDFARFITG